jgi:hypothetical protein
MDEEAKLLLCGYSSGFWDEPALTRRGISSYFVYMQIETLHDLSNGGARLYARCAWGRREGLKSVRACIGNVELDGACMLWTRGRDFPIAMLSELPPNFHPAAISV